MDALSDLLFSYRYTNRHTQQQWCGAISVHPLVFYHFLKFALLYLFILYFSFRLITIFISFSSSFHTILIKINVYTRVIDFLIPAAVVEVAATPFSDFSFFSRFLLIFCLFLARPIIQFYRAHLIHYKSASRNFFSVHWDTLHIYYIYFMFIYTIYR